MVTWWILCPYHLVDEMKVKISKKLDNLQSLINKVKEKSKEIGGIAVFVGTVRGTFKNEKVLRLEYEAHEKLAPKVLKQIILDLKKKYGIIDAVIEHKTGTAKVGEDVMYVLVASKHRREAFQALIEAVDRIKRETPIWKKEITEGSAHWVENQT